MNYVNATYVRKAIEVIQESGEVFEVRVISTARKETFSGYFLDADTLLKDLQSFALQNRNVYVTLNKLKPEVFSRSQSENIMKVTQTTSDTEVISYRWLFIDLDPQRMSGVSSSDEELASAHDLANKVISYMKDLGFADPVVAESGNGYHLLYRIDIPNNAEGRELVGKCLKVLDSIFSTDMVKIDTTNSNPSRICKLHGTLAQKGKSSAERPHRMSRIIEAPEPVVVNSIDVVKRLASELPDPEPVPKKQTVTRGDFDVVEFMRMHGMTYKEDSNDRAKIFRLDECPFDPSHKDGDAKVFLYPNGAVAFKCHHNSCMKYRWQDVRLKFEPDAYTKEDEADAERIAEGWAEHVRKRDAELKANKKKERKIRKLKTAEALMQKDLPEPRVFVGVGDDLPMLVEGTCILSAKPKLGKSWLALCLCLAVAKGEDFLDYKTRQCSTLYLDLETSEIIQQKRLKSTLKGADAPSNFYLETEADTIDTGLLDQLEAYLVEDPEIGIIVIDVFQIVRSPSASMKETEYEHAYRDITPLNEFAQKYHVSIILVCHDRKTVDLDDPFSNILGSTGLQGAATQMIVMYRRKKDDPIHISVKGKTIDGLPEIDAEISDAKWKVVAGGSSDEREAANMMRQFKESQIRVAVNTLLDAYGHWRGRSSELPVAAAKLGVAITESPKMIGGFMHRHVGRFLSEDDVLVTFVSNGSGGKTYDIKRSTVDTVDTVDGEDEYGFVPYEEPSVFKGFQASVLL